MRRRHRRRHQRLVWWCFDRFPVRIQDWAESWARTLIVRRSVAYRSYLEREAG
jgi:hypothetical protein